MKKQWYRLDNAALIFPAIIRKNWNNVFRVSATLKEPVDPEILDQAIADLKPRFPTYFVRLRRGFFWYYLETITDAPKAQKDFAYPLTHMTRRELKTCCVRFLYYENRIAVEVFHSVTDGTGGLILLKNLTAQYLRLKYGVTIPPEGHVVDMEESPRKEETRDCFLSCGADRGLSRAEDTAYRLSGTPETGRFRYITTGIMPADILKEKAHEQGVTVTAYLATILAEAVDQRQKAEGRTGRKARPVKITIPVNLRRTFGMDTFRNFTLAVNIGFDPRLGEYTHEQICALMGHQLAAETIPQRMAGSGENKGCLNLSNMGVVTVPKAMEPMVQRFDFVIGVQYTYPNNCSVVTYDGKTYVSMIRGIRESELERLVFSRLVELGVPVEIESNS